MLIGEIGCFPGEAYCIGDLGIGEIDLTVSWPVIIPVKFPVIFGDSTLDLSILILTDPDSSYLTFRLLVLILGEKTTLSKFFY